MTNFTNVWVRLLLRFITLVEIGLQNPYNGYIGLIFDEVCMNRRLVLLLLVFILVFLLVGCNVHVKNPVDGIMDGLMRGLSGIGDSVSHMFDNMAKNIKFGP